MKTDNAPILIIGPAWVGDMMMSQVLLKLIKAQHPDAPIDVIAPPHSAPLLARMPEVRHFIPLAIGHGKLELKIRYEMAKSLRATGYQQAYVLPNSFKSAFIPFLAKIPKRTGWLGECRLGLLNDVRFLDKSALPLMIQRFAALAFPRNAPLPTTLPWPALNVDEAVVASTLQAVGLSKPTKPILALCPGAEFGPAKRWPAYHYAEVAKQKLAEGYDVWLLGSPKEQADAAEIMAITDQRCVDLTGKTSLAQAIDLLSLASIVVSNDSGLMHIAAALQRPLVVLYGSSSPGFTPPLSDKVEILSLHLPCSPCFKRECPLGHLKCLVDLMPAQVLTAIGKLV